MTIVNVNLARGYIPNNTTKVQYDFGRLPNNAMTKYIFETFSLIEEIYCAIFYYLPMYIAMLSPSFIFVVQNLQIKDNRLELFLISCVSFKFFYVTSIFIALVVVIKFGFKRYWQIISNTYLFISFHFFNSIGSKDDPMDFFVFFIYKLL